MIPILAIVKFRTEPSRNHRLWIPLFLVWLLLLPLMILLLPFFLIGCLVGQRNPFYTLYAGWQVMNGLVGTHVEIDTHQFQFLIRII